MDDEEAHETLEGLLARMDAIEKSIGVVAKALINHLPHAEETLVDGFDAFARKARQEKCHEDEIFVYERLAEWLRRDAELREGKKAKRSPKKPER